ncbi:hypothetical protein GWI33_016988 [Rhynchophorus ferrugineus]|uniref:Uncharacterized protein n=1 Tax=Rhynchophorus ferrugineus TaxID=354439 RepID=A0A834I0R8_RHYFE|nr:hypothetical protein GWI33_016988 [Rhynchophorus ferrugineus]
MPQDHIFSNKTGRSFPESHGLVRSARGGQGGHRRPPTSLCPPSHTTAFLVFSVVLRSAWTRLSWDFDLSIYLRFAYQRLRVCDLLTSERAAGRDAGFWRPGHSGFRELLNMPETERRRLRRFGHRHGQVDSQVDAEANRRST